MQKIKNDLPFEPQLDAAFRRLTSSGFEISRDKIMSDIQKVVAKKILI
ncbi:MAG: hypothetical protein ACK5HP_01825 [Bacilli bacterium]